MTGRDAGERRVMDRQVLEELRATRTEVLARLDGLGVNEGERA